MLTCTAMSISKSKQRAASKHTTHQRLRGVERVRQAQQAALIPSDSLL